MYVHLEPLLQKYLGPGSVSQVAEQHPRATDRVQAFYGITTSHMMDLQNINDRFMPSLINYHDAAMFEGTHYEQHTKERAELGKEALLDYIYRLPITA
jgi:hypothetical protein